MRFLVDENSGPTVARWLRGQGHEVFSVYEETRGLSDDELIQKAFAENWILITSDKDFGEKVYREHYPHKGIILLRLEDERTANKIAVLSQLFDKHSDRLTNYFVVVTESQVRFARVP
jgi:predicted nuclease of predicted toxin-antitoxin system